MAREWVVVGGGAAGGIVVRQGQARSSPELPQRLGTGAVVVELSRVEERLCFALVCGDGPKGGWVTISLGGKPLLAVREPPREFRAGRPRGQPLPPGSDSWGEWEQRLWTLTDGAFHPTNVAAEHRKRRSSGSPGGHGHHGGKGHVSVVCPTTEARQQFHESILWACFEAQIWPRKELVVVETYWDRPSPFLSELAKRDSRLVYFAHRCPPEQDWSIGLKRNLCTYLATGEFIAHFDDDDLYTPAYLNSMVMEMTRRSAVGITLSSWYIVDTSTGTFGYCDPVIWGNMLDEPLSVMDHQVRSKLYGYGFSYVYRRDAAMEFPYRDVNLGEDYHFFSELQRSKGSQCIAVLEDKYGICLHTQHQNNTSKAFAIWEVPLESVSKLEFADFMPVFGTYLRHFPKIGVPSGGDCIYLLTDMKRTPHRRFRNLTVHAPAGKVEVRCPAVTDAAELWDLLEDTLGALPTAACLFRIPPPGWVSDAERDEYAEKMLRVLMPGAPPLRSLRTPGRALEEEGECAMLSYVTRALAANDRIGTRCTELWLAYAEGVATPPSLGTSPRRLNTAVHVSCSGDPAPGSVLSVFHVDVPLDATVGHLRELLGPALGAQTQIHGKLPGEGSVALEDHHPVPWKVVLAPTAAILVKDLMVLTAGQVWQLQDLLLAIVSRRSFQRRLDELEAKAGGRRARYRTGLAGILIDEVYPVLLRFFGLPPTAGGQTAMLAAVMRLDLVTIEKAHQLEVLMRNEARVKMMEDLRVKVRAGVPLPPK